MRKITICTFNVENLFSRRHCFPLARGITTRKTLNGEVSKSKYCSLYKNSAPAATALALTRGNVRYPDICCLQEVESMEALRVFNAHYLNNKFPYILVIHSHDPRFIDIGLLSMCPLSRVVSHIDERDHTGQYLFSRDCLEATFNVNSRPLTLFINHLKSPFGRTPKDKSDANGRRKVQAGRAMEIIRKRFPNGAYNSENYAVLGDFNDSPDSDFIAPLVRDSGLENVINRLDKSERWTYWSAGNNLVSQSDYILLSPALSRSSKEKPEIERRGISGKRKKSYFALPGNKRGDKVDFSFTRFAGITDEVDASDHCPLFFEVTV